MSDLNQIYQLLTDVKGDLGEMKGTLDSHVKAFDKHIEDDRKAYGAIIEIKQSQARQKGFIAGMATVGTAVGAGLAWLAERVFLSSHH